MAGRGLRWDGRRWESKRVTGKDGKGAKGLGGVQKGQRELGRVEERVRKGLNRHRKNRRCWKRQRSSDMDKKSIVSAGKGQKDHGKGAKGMERSGGRERERMWKS